ncbi:MAG TPA: YggS family pyridoxal phosphate-dependent enzyme [Actinomycetota bacterium]|nr:YggS family pyridoxal phosphate-dependent enzyme [Actinomycetota bacterium]
MNRAVDPAVVAANVASVRERVAAAAGRAGRDPAEVTLVAVAKLFPAEAVRAVVAAGVTDVGENYAQDLERKAAAVPGVRWHFVGRLQRNKAGVLVDAGALVHSLDSLAGARALGRRAVAAGTVARALVQVEVDDREAAHGVRPADLDAFLEQCRAVEGLQVEGLMVMPAPADDPEATRPAFRRAAELTARAGLPRLSMGMTADFEVAVEEGATLLRVGTALFGPRPTRRPARAGGAR